MRMKKNRGQLFFYWMVKLKRKLTLTKKKQIKRVGSNWKNWWIINLDWMIKLKTNKNIMEKPRKILEIKRIKIELKKIIYDKL